MSTATYNLTGMAKVVRVFFLLLRLLAVAATLCAVIVMATSHDSTIVFGITLEAKFQHTPALVFFVIANGIAFIYSLIVLFVPSTSLLSRSIIVFDVILAMLLTAAIAAAGAMAQLGKKGNSHAGWFPICDRVPNFCDHVMGAMICGCVGVVTFLLIVFYDIHQVLSPKFP
ncbi:CASP-like protein 1C1 [Curcuma longa]|uniref:CASP-like protein 1C1 n=1 Tax=Curcuma longa TaxID=136217 RepID=UPI003D9F5E74